MICANCSGTGEGRHGGGCLECKGEGEYESEEERAMERADYERDRRKDEVA